MKIKGSPFVWVSFAMIVGVMGTALISPLYGLYQAQWQLKPSDISLIYVIYMGGALAGLLFLGRLPDRLGFRPVMLGGLSFALIGTLITLSAWNMVSLCVGRIFVGVASSMLTTSSILGMGQLAPPENKQRVAMLSSLLIAAGFGLGPLVGGVVGQWLPHPLVLAYVPTVVLCLVALFILARLELPTHAEGGSGRAFHLHDVLPKITWPAVPLSGVFVLTSCLAFLSFAVFGLYASLSPLFLDKLVPWQGPVVSGSALVVILFGSAITQALVGRMAIHRCGSFGLLCLALSNALLVTNLWLNSATLFVFGVALTAMGHGACLLTGMRMLNRIATKEVRAGLFSTYLVIGYIGSMVPVMAMGWIADHWGMSWAVSLFCGVAISIALFVAAAFYRHPRTQP